jgi:hypothetical protein
MLLSREIRAVGLTVDNIEEPFEIKKALETIALSFSIQSLSIMALHKCENS